MEQVTVTQDGDIYKEIFLTIAKECTSENDIPNILCPSIEQPGKRGLPII